MRVAHLLLAGVSALAVSADDAAPPRCFPADFMFGSATASYQVEGAWNEGGRTPSIWDEYCRTHHKKVSCANVADDFYHRFRDDVKLMVETGLQSSRFSVSWSRAMNWDQSTRRMVPNPQGLAFYHALVDELNANNVVPILTLYHWDLPLELHSELSPQGWLNPDIVDHFVEYAMLMYHELGDKVEFWTTFNEPLTFTTAGYASGAGAPGLKKSETFAYIVAHNVIRSHAAAVKAFRDLKASSSVLSDKARISITLNSDYAYPLDAKSPLDVAAAERKMQFELGWFLEPMVSGDYPAIMRERVGERLPRFTPEETALVKGSYDLLMLNHYSSKLVTDCSMLPASKPPCKKLGKGWERDLGVNISRSNELPGSRRSSKNRHGKLNCGWFTAYPPGYLETIKWLHAADPTADILLTENGWCGNDVVENSDQLWYYQEYVAQVHKALVEEKIPIIGYTAWSFLDNYEWGSFEPRFGLYYVNFSSNTGEKDEAYSPHSTGGLERIPRPAAKWFGHVARTKCLDGWTYEAPAKDEQLAGLESINEQSFSRWMMGIIGVLAIVGLTAMAAVGRNIMVQLSSPNARRLPRETDPLLQANTMI
jgi:beta-glucosidase/6-phospho-beta-glucosidase/beta-galactosidase